MANIKFTDGAEFDLSGDPRIERRADGLYVVGQGLLVPVKSMKEAKEVLDEMKKPVPSH